MATTTNKGQDWEDSTKNTSINKTYLPTVLVKNKIDEIFVFVYENSLSLQRVKNEFDISLNTRALLIAKETFHQDQIKYHKQELHMIQMILEGLPEIEDNIDEEETLTELEKEWLRWQTWEPVILDLLERSSAGLKSAEILDIKTPKGYKNKDLRRKYIGIISQCLTRLKDKGKVIGKKIEGEKGDLYTFVNQYLYEKDDNLPF